ncbi:GH25 family lysozyme [Bartonella apihabitans]|nr:GH25 family lysozyme [Bartonella apihabitans]
MSFAYIKATEGGDFKDPEFKKNWDHALEAGLRVGAYHFFRPETDGVLQAENFISSMPKYKNMLPPAIDVEIDQTKSPDRRVILERLGNLLQHVESYYGSKPIIYTDEENYKNYIAGQFSGYLLWYRSIFSKPDLPNEKQWAFWQYNPVGRLQGYKGKEFFIDLNVFNGTRDLFETFPTGW